MEGPDLICFVTLIHIPVYVYTYTYIEMAPPPRHLLPQTICFERFWVQLTTVYLYASLHKTAENTVFYVVFGGFRNKIRLVKLHACFIIRIHSDVCQYICASGDFSQIRILLLFVFFMCIRRPAPNMFMFGKCFLNMVNRTDIFHSLLDPLV